jgi:hypothetical protein
MFDHRYIEQLERKIDALTTLVHQEFIALRKDLAMQHRASAPAPLDADTLAKIDKIHARVSHLSGFFAQLRP